MHNAFTEYKPRIRDGHTLDYFFEKNWLPNSNKSIPLKQFKRLAKALRKDFSNEDEFTDWFGSWLQDAYVTLSKNMCVRMTRKKAYLNWLKPDISILPDVWFLTSALSFPALR